MAGPRSPAGYYFIGKDNIPFHTVIWPSILLGVGRDGETVGGQGEPLRLPDDLVSSEFLTMEGRRFSASRGIGIEVRDFLDRYDPDTLRYYLTIAGPETSDTDFTWAEFVRRTNDELVANWGNLVHRTLTLVHRHFGQIPEQGSLTDADVALVASVDAGFDTVGGALDRVRFKAALTEVMRLAASVNRYLGEEEPWKSVEIDRGRAATVLWVAVQGVANLAVLLAPFLPLSSQRALTMLGEQPGVAPLPRLDDAGAGEVGGDPHLILTGDYGPSVGHWESRRLPTGRPLETPTPLFHKLDPAIVDEEVERMAGRARR